jgi:ribosomal protein S18 acetylase RimI-like enzyme
MACECDLVFVPIKSDCDVENLRTIRNECRNFMTRNTNEISKEQQKNWYSNVDKEKNKLFLLHQIHHGVTASPVGYGYIRIEDDHILLSGGLVESERGKGYGQLLFHSLVQNSKKFGLPIKLEVLKTNTVAFSIYSRLGFKFTGDDGKIITMEYNYDSSI